MKPVNEPAFRVIQTNPAIGEKGLIHVYGADPASPRPYVLGIHGGGWRNGDQTSFAWMWPRLQALGVALVLPSYRLAPGFRYPCAYEDLVHLQAWLRDHGAAEGLDPSRCLLFGSSAGGHLVMLLATRATKELRPMPVIRGVVNYCGVTDMAAQQRFDAENGATMTEEFMGGLPDAHPDAYREASPLTHVHGGVPPVWMAHGSADRAVSVAQSREMVSALAAVGANPVYLEARGLGHTMIELSPSGRIVEPYQLLFEDDVLRFMHRTLCKPGASDEKSGQTPATD